MHPALMVAMGVLVGVWASFSGLGGGLMVPLHSKIINIYAVVLGS